MNVNRRTFIWTFWLVFWRLRHSLIVVVVIIAFALH